MSGSRLKLIYFSRCDMLVNFEMNKFQVPYFWIITFIDSWMYTHYTQIKILRGNKSNKSNLVYKIIGYNRQIENIILKQIKHCFFKGVIHSKLTIMT